MNKEERTFIKETTSTERGWRIASLILIFLAFLSAYLEAEPLLTALLFIWGLIWFITNECLNRGIIDPRGAKSIWIFIDEAEKFLEVEPINSKEIQTRLDDIEKFKNSYSFDLPQNLKTRISKVSKAIE